MKWSFLGLTDSIAGIVSSANFCAHFSSTMSRSAALHLGLAFGSFLFLSFATQCLAFPQREQEQPERIGAGDLENSSMTPEQTPQLPSSEDAIIAPPEPSAVSLNKILLSSKETQPTRAGLLQSGSAGLYTAAELEVPAGEDTFGSSQLEGLSAESKLSKAMLTTTLPAAASLSPDEEEPLSSSRSQPFGEGTTEAAQSFLTYVDNQLFASENQKGGSLGPTPSSCMDTEEMQTSSSRMEKLEAATDQRTPTFPGAESTADTVPRSLTPNGEKTSQMTADSTQATATQHLLVPTAVYTLSVELETDSLLGAAESTVRVSSTVPATSVLSEEWDETKLESGSQTRAPKGDSPEVTEVVEVALGLPEGEALLGPALPTSQGDMRFPAATQASSSAPMSLLGGPELSQESVFQGAEGVMDSTKEESTELLGKTTASASEYQSEADRLRGHMLKDIIIQEMTTAAQEPSASPLFEMQEQVSALEVPRVHGDREEATATEAPSPVSDAPGVTQLSRGWGPLATEASTAVTPLSPEVIPAAEGFMDAVTLPNEEFIPVRGFSMTPAGMVEEETGSFLAPSAPEASSEGTLPFRSSASIAPSYGLEQLESEEGEDDEDEEDEEDEDEEEEEDEEDKDTDSLDESFDSDTELPGFTLPGVTSQEPDLERGMGDPLRGATYQVPDAIEWEHRNQGLVRSWMEKLKDKAGYMSGMLVPVGVGIAGALFILGALYSIKVMNRRRRNGFKRHKRKREFNSMQDRVMLLADSSEDEF
ncbi:armadillo-like helical domain-containing protein 4 isoform X2 [Cavia porcellus]|uniref:armadillo-like helical domain-containing protein 4 isoform X2 n=1 Tax=Cavia porcellus TaxID=10141 RepID=UPI002FDF125A